MNSKDIISSFIGDDNISLKKSSKKILTFYIKSENREYTRSKISELLCNNKINFSIKKLPESGFFGIETVEDKKYRYIFKPINSAGSGAGHKKTEIVESAQLYVCDFLRGNEWVSYDDLFSCKLDSDLCFSKINIEDIKELIKDLNWRKSLYSSGLAINSYLNKNKIYEFHRKTDKVESIYNNLSNIKDIPFKIKYDKWNPSDIWAFDKDYLFNIPTYYTLIDYNKFLLDKLINKEMIGISLKKIENFEKPKIEEQNFIFNIINSDAKILNIIYSRDKDNIFLSKDTNVYFEYDSKDNHIQLRSFNILVNIQGEIRGKTANHGKIGLNMMSYLMHIDSPIKLLEINNENIKLFKEELLLQRKQYKTIDKKNENEIFKQLGYITDIATRLDKFNSKYQAIFIANRLSNENIREIYLYASSQSNNTFQSAPHIKVY